MSGPLLDRIDLTIEVPSVSAETFAFGASSAPHAEDSAMVRARVIEANSRQRERQSKLNARLTVSEVAQHCAPPAEAQALLEQAMSRLSLSARAHHRVLKVARTIADLAGRTLVDAVHLAEAIGYRQFERR